MQSWNARLRSHGATRVKLCSGLGAACGQVQRPAFARGTIVRGKGSERHLCGPPWTLDVEPVDGGGRRVHARFSPSSPVWPTFVATRLALACLLAGSACHGGARQLLGGTPWAYVGVPIALALAGSTHGAAFLGQGLGAEDLYVLRRLVGSVAGEVREGQQPSSSGV